MIGARQPKIARHEETAVQGGAITVPAFAMPGMSNRYLDKVVFLYFDDKRNKEEIARRTDTRVEDVSEVVAAYEAYVREYSLF